MPNHPDRPRARRYARMPGSEMGLALAAMAARAARRDLDNLPSSDEDPSSPPAEEAHA